MKVARAAVKDVFWFRSTTRKVVALTIDDAPTPNTPQVLDILDQYNVKATFFVISDYATKHPEIMERIKNSGHQMTNHMNKDQASWLLKPESFESGLLQCDKILDQYGAFKKEDGKPAIKFMRPGSGLFTNWMKQICKKHKYKIALGNVHPFDPQIKIPWISARHVILRSKPGSIIILHDRPQLLKSLPQILDKLKNKKQFEFLRLTELYRIQDDKSPIYNIEEEPDQPQEEQQQQQKVEARL